MDKVFVKGLRIKAHLGIYEWEQRIPQTVLIDLEMHTDTREAAANDEVDKTVNYRLVSDRVQHLLANRKFQLVETVAEAIAQMIQDEFGVTSLRVTVAKPSAFADAEQVGVTIER
jgi:dihydroneopterin aldolase